jgi:septal ring factor EnvC (AmiA/AmiB activator)
VKLTNSGINHVPASALASHSTVISNSRSTIEESRIENGVIDKQKKILLDKIHQLKEEKASLSTDIEALKVEKLELRKDIRALKSNELGIDY